MDSSKTDIVAANLGKILLIVEDQEAQHPIADILVEEGYHVDVSHGDSAPLSAHRRRPDLILIDNSGCNQSSQTILDKIKSDPTLRDMQVILTNPPQGNAGELPTEPEVYADGYFRHPADTRQLLARVRALMRQHEVTKILTTSEERYRNLVEASHDLIWVLDAEGLILFANRACLDIYGYEPESMIGRRFVDFAPLGEGRKQLASFNAARQSGNNTLDYESRVFRNDGNIITISTNARIIRNSEGKVIGHIGVSRDITERKVTEQLNRQLSRAVEQTASTVVITDAKGTIEYVNPRFSETTGYSAEEAIGKKPSILKSGQATAQTYTDLWQTITSGQTWRGEFLNRKKCGEFYWEYATISPVTDEYGDVSHFIAVKEDITERKRVEQALAYANRALEILNRCNESLIRAEQEPDLLDSVCRIAVETGGFSLAWVGYANDDREKTVVPVAHAGADDGFLSSMEISWDESRPTGKGPSGQAIRSGQAVTITQISTDEMCRPWQDISRKHGIIGVVALPLKNQYLTFGVLCLYLPEARKIQPEELMIYERLADSLAFGILSLRTRQEQRANARKIAEQASLLDKTQDAIFVRDFDQHITYWNQGAERLYGWTAREVIGQVLDLRLPDDHAQFQEAERIVLECGEWNGQLQKVNKHGETLRLDSSWTLLSDEENRPQYILVIDTDVTKRHALEEQFFRAQRMDSIGTLAGGIAHDINNVLAPILMAAELLRIGESNEKRLGILASMESSARRGADLVRQVLTFARGVEGLRVEIRSDSLIQDIVSLIRETFPRNIHIETIIPAPLWPITGDPTQLHQILLNLCVNARDSMPHGGNLILSAGNVMLEAELAARLTIPAKAGPHVLIQIQDTGCGIPAEIMDKIFDPFFTTKAHGKGTGLGLSTSTSIIKSHGGGMEVASDAGAGTTFRIYLPASQTPYPTETRETPSLDLSHGHGELILVVDDEAQVREIARQTLEAFGYRVLLAQHGEHALAIHEQHQDEIAAVLTDMMMPVMDGPAMIRELRKLRPTLPIIATSGLANESHIQTDPQTRFLAKPFAAEKLLHILRLLLSPAP